jgi:hypothetical protein
MNIRSVKTDVVSQPPVTITQKPTQPASTQLAAEDSFSPVQNATLVNMLQQQPEVRQEALQRAQALVADPNYPSKDILAGLAKLFISDAAQSE